ncbi:MAG: putative metal-binding motif-containing protein [candidate division Zixibacteria bacterium]
MRKIVLFSVIVLMAIAVLEPVTLAAIPEIVTYQGQLNDGDGDPVDGEHGVTIYLFDEVTGGVLLWQEEQTVAFSSGLFTVQLGTVTENPLDLLFDQQYWLGIAIDGGAELQPRIPLTSAPQAFRAKYVDQISLGNIQEFWQLAQSIPDFDGDGHDKIWMDGDDCDDLNPFVYPGADEYCDGIDNDCNGIIDDNTVDCPEGMICSSLQCIIPDYDGDGWPNDQDCDDYNPFIYPGAPELCDGLDNDCNDVIDDNVIDCPPGMICDSGIGQCVYVDMDEDGYTSDVDCDDNNPNVYPGAPEYCNGIDDDCNGTIDDNVIDCPSGAECINGACSYVDMDNDGYYSDVDCDDNNPDVYPGAYELCDGLDNDCNGFIDDADYDLDGYNVCDDCDDSDPSINPGTPEICDGFDNNCDGNIDDVDEDGDGFYACTEDCDDNDPNVHPQAPEICGDSIDNNCDGNIDEGCP